MPAPALASRAKSSFAQAETGGFDPDEELENQLPAPAGAMSMVVNLRSQRGYVYRNGVRIATTTISSGKPGYRTPTGTFTVLEKQRIHHSNKYDNAPMPFMQRLSWWGLALHGGHVPGYPASHGCVRMPQSFAQWLYSQPTMGMTVSIVNQKTREENTAIASGEDRLGDEADRSRKAGDLHVTKFWSGRRGPNVPATLEPVAGAAAAMPAALPERTGEDEAGDASGDSPNAGNVYRSPDQRQDDERYPGQAQTRDDIDRSREGPPPNLPPADLPPQDLPQPPG
jgi:hypothetical protein